MATMIDKVNAGKCLPSEVSALPITATPTVAFTPGVVAGAKACAITVAAAAGGAAVAK